MFKFFAEGLGLRHSFFIEQALNSENHSVKNLILKVATSLFAEKGFGGVSVREISQEAKVNVAMVSYYFGNKEKLYLSCIENFAQASIGDLRKILRAPLSSLDFKNRFTEFLSYKMESLVQNREAHFIILREMQSERPEHFRKQIISELKPCFELMESFLGAAKQSGFIKESLDSRSLTLMAMGLLSQPFLAERFIQTEFGFSYLDQEHKKNYIEQVANLFFAGVLK